MTAAKKGTLLLEFFVYLGDPDDGVETISSETFLKDFDRYSSRLAWDRGVYGGVCVMRDGKRLFAPVPDPIVRLMTGLVRILPYVIDGEAESALLSESEHGFLFEPGNDQVQISFFRGNDAFDPEEYILAGAPMSIDEFGTQLTAMGERLVTMLKKHEPEVFENDEGARDFSDMLKGAKEAFKNYKLAKEHGLRQ